eukprot:c14123_g1_i1.p1 GENE.c14123_g1_i1~~c14123_g1_i1.p1  ORF type:complete len:269 (+),score=106.83 c14123_g1_i1:26-808(+)
MDTTELEQFCLLAKSATGKGCAALVMQAISSQSTFVFGELLDCPNVANLASQEENKSVHKLLEVFAFGTYNDYKANASSLPSLSKEQKDKLKQLTIATLSTESQILEYSTLLSVLDCADVRELEDLIIDAMNKDILKGRLDQQKKHLQVTWCLPRDVPDSQILTILNQYKHWQSNADRLITQISGHVKFINEKKQNEINQNNEFAQKLEEAKKNPQTKVSVQPEFQDNEGAGFFGESKGKGSSSSRGPKARIANDRKTRI